MIFSKKFSKFGKGNNLSAYMPSSNSIKIYNYNSGIQAKNITINNDDYSLIREVCNMPYNAVIQIDDNSFITRLDKSIGVYINE